MKLEEVTKIFAGTGFTVSKFAPIENQYWPSAYTELREANPWWLVTTEFGVIKIGWRKRVISIHWDETLIRGQVTPHDVTKDSDMVHAYTEAAATEYLTELRHLADVHEIATVEPALPRPVTIQIYAHSRDTNQFTVWHSDGAETDLTEFSQGYVPRGIGIGGGDALQLTVDIETGRILNWDAEKVKAHIATTIEEGKYDL